MLQTNGNMKDGSYHFPWQETQQLRPSKGVIQNEILLPWIKGKHIYKTNKIEIWRLPDQEEN